MYTTGCFFLTYFTGLKLQHSVLGGVWWNQNIHTYTAGGRHKPVQPYREAFWQIKSLEGVLIF